MKTLHGYLARDLMRVTLLALAALTMIMTIFAVVEPLRKQGLDAEQLVSLFTYTLPATVSLTLPIAALFAATIVYGRFAQDNELMACRASGIATVSLLRPALVLGVVISILTLLLSNFVTPRMAASGEKAIMSNVQGIFFGQLRRFNYVRYGTWIIHADQVDDANESLYGLVVMRTGSQEDGRVLSASRATVKFHSAEDGYTYLVVRVEDPCVTELTSDLLMREGSQEFAKRLPTESRDEPEWYDWNKLARTLEDPTRNKTVRAALEAVRLRVRDDLMGRRVVAAINEGKGYGELRDGENRYVIEAGKASVETDGRVKLASVKLPSGQVRPVKITIYHGDRVSDVLVAEAGGIESGLVLMEDAYKITLRLKGNVRSELGTRLPQRDTWMVGQIPLPADVVKQAAQIRLASIFEDSKAVTDNSGILTQVKHLRDKVVRKLLAEIRSEMHGRVSYGVSCLLLVTMGAALGLIFRGGQVVSAFAISVVPAAVVIILVMMGKQLATNPSVAVGGMDNVSLGLAVIWSGNVLLLIANFVVHGVLRRI